MTLEGVNNFSLNKIKHERNLWADQIYFCSGGSEESEIDFTPTQWWKKNFNDSEKGLPKTDVRSIHPYFGCYIDIDTYIYENRIFLTPPPSCSSDDNFKSPIPAQKWTSLWLLKIQSASLNHYAASYFAYPLWRGGVKSVGGVNRKDPENLFQGEKLEIHIQNRLIFKINIPNNLDRFVNFKINLENAMNFSFENQNVPLDTKIRTVRINLMIYRMKQKRNSLIALKMERQKLFLLINL